MKPQERMTSSTPCRRSHSSMYEMKGWPARGTTGLGMVEVSGRSRVPSPPARIRACTSCPLSAADALVHESGGLDDVAGEEVAAVDDQAPGHPFGHPRPVELGELGPFR